MTCSAAFDHYFSAPESNLKAIHIEKIALHGVDRDHFLQKTLIADRIRLCRPRMLSKIKGFQRSIRNWGAKIGGIDSDEMQNEKSSLSLDVL